MPTPEEISHQRSLLDIHRNTLAHLLRQAAAHGGVDFAPAATAYGIRNARAEIQRIKDVLRGWGAAYADHPDDEEATASTPTSQPARAPAGGPTYNFYAPIHSGATNFGGQQTIDTLEANMGDNISISNVSGAILNIKSTLEQVTQTISSMAGDDTAKNQLKQLIAELQSALQQVPPDKAQDAQEVAKRAEAAVAEAAKPKPDKEDAAYSLSRLKKAAENLGQVLPIVVTIAGKIAAQIMGMLPA